MIWTFSILTLLVTFIAMELVTWLLHKYVMHGFLWKWHEDHHNPHDKTIERNDRFSLVFALSSAYLIIYGMSQGAWFTSSIGFGILMYGIAYFLVHDVFIHRRMKYLRQIDHPYFQALRKAHKVHHKHLGKEKGECFGMLLVPRKYYSYYSRK